MNNNNNSRISFYKNAFNIWQNAKDIFIHPHERFSAVDGIRALAILYTLLFHAAIAIGISTGYGDSVIELVKDTPWYFQWIIVGDRGVDAFFVISGFLIGQLLFKEHIKTNTINLRRFFLRRFMRLTPVYYLLLLICALTTFQHKEYLLAFALYLNNFIDINHQGYLSYTWSLAVEEQFYIVFSIFMFLFFNRIKYKLICLLSFYVLSFVIPALILFLNPDLLTIKDVFLAGPGSISPDYWETIYDNLYTRFGPVMGGVILAYLYMYHWPALERFMTPLRSNCITVFALAIFGLFFFMPLAVAEEIPFFIQLLFHISHRNLFGFAVALLVLTSLFKFGLGGFIGTILSSKLLYPFSQLSYSIYLIHPFMLLFMLTILKNLGVLNDVFSYANVLMLGFCSLPIIFLVCSVIYIFIERPFMKLRS